MTQYNFTPTSHPVFNEFDRLGLLLGLPRLEDEKNAEYKRRLFDVFVNRADSTYRGLINGITRELGLEIFEALTITRTAGVYPAVVFQDTKCYVYGDYTLEEDGLVATLDRFESSEDSWTYFDLANSITDTGYFDVEVVEGVNTNDRSMQIFNQSTIGSVIEENISTAGASIKLAHEKLIPNSIIVRSSNLIERVSSQEEIRRKGQYYIDAELGVISTFIAPAPGSAIRYKYRNDSYIALASPVIIHNLQGTDFRTKMFEQILQEDGTYTNGQATPLGADIINELMSVFPSQWGK